MLFLQEIEINIIRMDRNEKLDPPLLWVDMARVRELDISISICICEWASFRGLITEISISIS